ncbi:MAG: ribosome assembly factor SBDS, partial [Candidatus Methanomethylicota archaeon]
MPKADKAVIARLSAFGEHFEVLVDPDLAWAIKSGKSASIKEALISDLVYKDARKGLKASDESLKKVFKTTDVLKVAEEIIKKGDLQLTAEQRRALIESKRRQIIDFIAKNCVDPKTGTPHPPL